MISDFSSFFETYKAFSGLKTWTSEKHFLKSKLLDIFKNKKRITFKVHYRSKNCILNESNDFLFIKINN